MHSCKVVKVRDYRKLIRPARDLVTQAQTIKIPQANVATEEWTKAKPFHSIPGPTRLQLLKDFMPGGCFRGQSVLQLNECLRKNYGDIFLLPGIFGKRSVVYTFNPLDFKLVFRTEGLQPVRRGFDIIPHYRKVLRPDIFKHAGGLIAEQGDGWAHFRSTVNPVLMNPKTINMYAPKMNKVADALIARIREIREPHSMEVPANFEQDLNHWAMDSVGLVALDADLGLIKNAAGNPKAHTVIDDMRVFFQLLFELDVQPSLWKYLATPKYRRCIKAMDNVTELARYYIDEAIQHLQSENGAQLKTKAETEKSVLERLLGIDPTVAIVMAMDLLLGGSDSTTSALTGCLLCLAKNPEKQQKLRREIEGLLPTANTEVSSEILKHLPYLRACIKEALRFYPVAPINFRATGQDIVLSGYRVPKNTSIAMPGQLLQRDPKYYSQPNEFLPERWLRGEQATDACGCPLNNNVPFVYLPFGFGPRICIGKRIVDRQLEIVLAKLVRNFDIRFDHPAVDMFRTHVLNVPCKPLQFKFTDVNNMN